MPTIDQLAPATAASDTDEMLVSQNGTARKITRAQILAGVQPEIAVACGVLLGRASAGTGAPEPLTIGANLQLLGGTLSATAQPYTVAALPAGTVPVAGDLVPLAQGGANTAVPYAQFINGISGITDLDASRMLVTPTGSGTGATLADFAAGTMRLAGGTMTGAITQAPTHEFWAQNGEIINRLGGRLLVGGATAGDGAYPNVNQDWLTALGDVSYNGGAGVDSNGTTSQVAILTDAANGSPACALTVGAQSFLQTSVYSTAYPLNIVAVNNNTTIATSMWGAYLEAHRANNVVGETTGVEIEVRNSGSTTVHDPFAFFKTGQVSGLQLGAGAGLSARGQANVGYAMSIFANPMQFNSGILFLDGSLAATQPGGATTAIGMPIAYELDWFSSAGTLAARVYGDSTDALNVVAAGGIRATGPLTAPSIGGIVNTGIYADQAQNIASAATDGSMTVANGVSWQIYNPPGTLAAFTTTMPPNPVDGQDIYFSTDNTIIAWTLLPNAGQAVSGAPGTLASTQSVHFRWNSATGYWFRM